MAACEPRACMLVPGTVGTGSFSSWLILGTVSLRVLSFGPLATPPAAVSSWGMLKPPGSSLFVAVLFRLLARKKDVMSATPAAIMARLRSQETKVLVCDVFINLGDCNIGLAWSALGGQILPHPPLVPRAVVVGEVR